MKVSLKLDLLLARSICFFLAIIRKIIGQDSVLNRLESEHFDMRMGTIGVYQIMSSNFNPNRS